MPFSEVLIAFGVGWLAAMLSTWFILAKPWLDRRMLPKQKPVVTPAVSNTQAGVQQAQTGPIKIV